MTMTSMVALFAAMFVLALIPGPAVLLVVTRSLSSGFSHGFTTTIGIICGDFIFIVLSVYGLLGIMHAMGDLFIFVKFAGAFYLIYLGICLLRNNLGDVAIKPVLKERHAGNFFAGLATTMGNPKAILFYLSFFPAFLDISAISALDLAIILSIAATSIGGVMSAYAFIACRTIDLFRSQSVNKTIGILSGSLLVGSGALLAFRH